MAGSLKIYFVDAFTKENSGGSPTAVVLDAKGLKDDEMQAITLRNAVSHTAFVFEPAHESENVKVRFFTARGEIKNCGHGTIAVHYLRAKKFGYTRRKTFFQHAKGGLQQIEIISSGNDTEIYLQQNEIQFSSVSPETIHRLMQALSISSTEIDHRFPPVIASPGSNRFLLGLKSNEIVNSVVPDFDSLKSICAASDCIGCFIYSADKTGSAYESLARMFAPNIGVDEDVINGNSSGCLGAYLLEIENESHVALDVVQGQKFRQEGVVKVRVKKESYGVKTVIGGTASLKSEIMLTRDREHQKN